MFEQRDAVLARRAEQVLQIGGNERSLRRDVRRDLRLRVLDDCAREQHAVAQPDDASLVLEQREKILDLVLERSEKRRQLARPRRLPRVLLEQFEDLAAPPRLRLRETRRESGEPHASRVERLDASGDAHPFDETVDDGGIRAERFRQRRLARAGRERRLLVEPRQPLDQRLFRRGDDGAVGEESASEIDDAAVGEERGEVRVHFVGTSLQRARDQPSVAAAATRATQVILDRDDEIGKPALAFLELEDARRAGPPAMLAGSEHRSAAERLHLRRKTQDEPVAGRDDRGPRELQLRPALLAGSDLLAADDEDLRGRLDRADVQTHFLPVTHRPRRGKHAQLHVEERRAFERLRRADDVAARDLAVVHVREVDRRAVPGRRFRRGTVIDLQPAHAARAAARLDLHAVADAQTARRGHARDDRAESGRGEHAQDRHAEDALRVAARRRADEPREFRAQRVETFAGHRRDRHERRALEERAADEVRDVGLHEREHLFVRGVDLRQRDAADRKSEKRHDLEVLARLRHHAVVRGDDEQHDVHARRGRDHVADELLVAGHVDDADFQTSLEHQLRVPDVDRQSARLLFRETIDVLGVAVTAGERAQQRRLAVIDVARGADRHGKHGARRGGVARHGRQDSRGARDRLARRAVSPRRATLRARPNGPRVPEEVAIVLPSAPNAVHPSTRTVRRDWRVAPVDPRRGEFARSLSIDELTAQCLLNRGVADEAAAGEFLRAGLGSLLRPEDLPDVAAAVARIRRAVRDGETICVWGDYDVDGVCGAAVMIRFLRLVGARVVPFIPERSGSGYGFHWPTMQTLAATGVRLFISVDHGSAAVEAITNARAAGLDVVVADHHEMSPTLPPAVAIVNPKRPDSRYAFPYLCGTGVAMKLAWAVAQDMSPGARVSDAMREFLLEALSFCVLGTVADVVPLVGENRVIVRYGLDVLAKSPRPGLAALLDVARVRGPVRASDIGFKLGPRLNAAGRMGSASLALELLLTDDRARAREIALQLDAENDRRRQVERAVAEEARDRVISELGATPPGIALMSDRWHPGVIGIVAARLVDEFNVPVVLVGVQAGVGKGSARSVRGFALHEALAACGGHLVAHGGHAGAAGLTIEPPRFDAFRDEFIRYVERTLDLDARTPRVRIDAEAAPADVDVRVAASMERLEPFGEGNPAPVLALRGVQIVGRPRRMGSSNEHVSFFAGRNGRALRCVAFRDAARIAPMLESGATLDVAVTPQKNEFRGASEAEGLVVDVRPAE